MGVDIDLTDSLFLNAEIRYLDIDPILYGVNFGIRF